MEPGPHDPTILGLVNFLAVLVLSVAFHEMAHAWLADRFGDPTPRDNGRMTLNPIAHVHPIFTVALPAVFWWGTGGLLFMGLTPVNPRLMRRPRLHGMLTALGGPVASLIAALAFLLLLGGFRALAGDLDSEGERRMLGVLRLGAMLNLVGVAFNLIPVPPLDGSHVLEFFLPRWAMPAWRTLERNAWMVILVLMFSGLLDIVMDPAVDASVVVVGVVEAFGRGLARG